MKTATITIVDHEDGEPLSVNIEFDPVVTPDEQHVPALMATLMLKAAKSGLVED